MTTTPPSPSGPAASGPPSQHSEPQPPYSATQFYPEEHLPYGYTAVRPTPPKRSNGPGFAALIIGIVSVVLAFIPFANFFSFLLGTVGIIVGIVGLVLTDRPRRQAIWGTVLSGLSLGIAFLMAFVYTFGFIFAVGGAIDEASRSMPTESPSTSASPSIPGEVFPLGTTVELVDAAGMPAYEATVTVSTLDATDEVLGNARNTEAPAGMQWALARITATPLSAASTDAATDITVEYVSPDGHSFSASDEYVVAPEPEFASLPPVTVGETATGFVVIAIPADHAASGFWALSLAESGTEPSYFAVE